jgi:hypothetical protein
MYMSRLIAWFVNLAFTTTSGGGPHTPTTGGQYGQSSDSRQSDTNAKGGPQNSPSSAGGTLGGSGAQSGADGGDDDDNPHSLRHVDAPPTIGDTDDKMMMRTTL